MYFKAVLITFISLLFLSPTITLSSDYYLYDHEQNEILYINDNLKTAIRKISLTKNPDFMMATGNSEKFLAVYNSCQTRDAKGQTSFQAGKIIIFNSKSGRTEDLLEIGFTPYRWAYTKDRLHFFFAYYSSPNKESMEIIHYNLSEKKTAKVAGIDREVVDLKLSFNEQALLAIVNPAKLPQELVTLQIAPFQIKSKLTIGSDAEHLYILGPDRAALVGINRKRGKPKSGIIKVIDTYGTAVVEERKLSFPNIGVYWYEKNRSLFVTNGQLADKLMEGRIYKITGAGVRQYQISRPWAGFSYLPEQDRAYILNDANLTLLDYATNSSKTIKLNGSNYYPGQYHYYFQRLPSTNLAIIACFEKGYIKFFDSEKNQVLKSSTCGRTGERILNIFTFKGDLESRTVATTNQWQSRFYVLNCATRDITVYDQAFNILKYIIPEEPPLAMFQVSQPTLQTLVVTAKRLYKIDEENVNLVPVTDFSTEITKVNYLKTNKDSLILYTDRLLMVLEPETLKVKHYFYLYGDPKEKFTKLKNDERRYYFIPEM